MTNDGGHPSPWILTGPARFAARVAATLAGGHSALLLLPEYGPPDPAGAVRAALGPSGEQWTRFRLPARSSEAPLDLLFDRLAPDAPPGAVRTPAALGTTPGLAGRIVWLDGANDLTPAAWAGWCAFLAEYHEVAARLDLFDRTVFLLILTGPRTLVPPAAGPMMLHHRWRGQLDRVDMLAYAAVLLRDRADLSPLQRRLAAATVARIALWDLDLAARLGAEPLATIVSPATLLADWAVARGWAGAAPAAPSGSGNGQEATAWSHGRRDDVEGVPFSHSAVLALADPYAELEHRLWCAEAEVLLPHIDQQRLRLIERLGDRLLVPWEFDVAREGGTVREQIEERGRLEISHVFQQILADPSVTGLHHKAALHLMQVRNELSHLKRVGPDLATYDHLDVLR